jgi:hypothetical protein
MADLVRRDPRMPVRFLSFLIRFFYISDSGDLELKSVQWSRRLPVQMETEHYQPGHRGESPATLRPLRDL